VGKRKRNLSVVCVCSAPNCCDTEQRSASQSGSVAGGTPVSNILAEILSVGKVLFL
jgi:hypothetical protein